MRQADEAHVIHILQDGTVLPDITGHVVRAEDAGQVYELMETINREIRRKDGNL